MDKCSYRNKHHCYLGESLIDENGFFVSDNFCINVCGPNNPNKQKELLHKRGCLIDNVPASPEDLAKYLKSHEIKYHDVAAERLKKSRERKQKIEKQQKEINDAVAELPSKYQMAKNLGRDVLKVRDHYKKTGRIQITDEHKKARRDICYIDDDNKCEKAIIDDKGFLRCGLKSCGCYLDGRFGDNTSRLIFEALPCDIGKHDEIDKKYIKD